MAVKNNESLRLLTIPLLICSLKLSAAQLIIEDAWVALAPPGALSHAAYVRLINNNKHAITIMQVSAVGYAQVMLHQTKIVKDRVQMSHLETLDIPAKTSVVLTPGETHLMLIKPQQSQKTNDHVSITLTLADGTQQQFMAQVQAKHE